MGSRKRKRKRKAMLESLNFVINLFRININAKESDMKTIRMEDFEAEEPSLTQTINEVLLILKSTLKKRQAAYDKWYQSGGDDDDLPWDSEDKFCSRIQLDNLRVLINELSSFPKVTKEMIFSNSLWYSWPDQEYVFGPLIANKENFEKLVKTLALIYMEVNKHGTNK